MSEVDVGLMEDGGPLEWCLSYISRAAKQEDESNLRHAVFDKLCNGNTSLPKASLCSIDIAPFRSGSHLPRLR